MEVIIPRGEMEIHVGCETSLLESWKEPVRGGYRERGNLRWKSYPRDWNTCGSRFHNLCENAGVPSDSSLKYFWDILVDPWQGMKRKWKREKTWNQNQHLPFLIIILVFIAPFGEAGESPSNFKRSSAKVCSTIDVRNDISSFEVLRDCEVIEGNLHVVLVANGRCDKVCEEQLNNITFPKLREVTGYVIFWRVYKLRSLGSLFPNLSVIRGRTLFRNYALVVFEMNSLEEVGLYSLTHILRGSVRFDKNKRLCFVETINWDMIARNGAERHYFGLSRPERECRRCPEVTANNEICPLSDIGEPLCWNVDHCQKDVRSCVRSSNNRECCHESCLGGCDGKSSKDCHACRGVVLNNDCLEKCPQNMYKFMDRRCVTADECIRIRKPYDWELRMVMKPYPFRPVQDVCTMACPADFVEEEYVKPELEGKRYRCVPCNGRCKKECDGASIDNLASIQELDGCTHIVGSLEIQLRFEGNVMEELERSLSSIEEISGYLKIVRSVPLVSLDFLKNLKLIKGEQLEGNKFAFVLLDNENIEELWDWSARAKELRIHGGVSCNYNPKLCLEKIKIFKEMVDLPPGAVEQISLDTNGDKVACNLTKLEPYIPTKRTDAVLIKWKPFQHYDPRKLLSYVIYSTEAPHRNVSYYHNRNACGGDGWKIDDIPVEENGNQDEMSYLLTRLKPFTQYAFYIKTYTIHSEKRGAQSDIEYFVTNPGTPTKPEELQAYSNSTSEIVVFWKPPVEANGNLTHYEISGFTRRERVMPGIDFCSETPFFTVEKELPPPVEKEEPGGGECACRVDNLPQKSGKKDTEDIRASKIAFEDALQDAFFVKKVNFDRRKREMTYTDSNHQQQLVHEMSAFSGKSYGERMEPAETLVFSEKVPHSRTRIVMKNLKYFTNYRIEVRACRAVIDDEDGSTPACSENSTVDVRTKKNEKADNIPDIVLIQDVVNGTLGEMRLKWEEPPNPNGAILSYQIEYRRIGSEKAKPFIECITRESFLEQRKEYVLKNLLPGNYTVHVLASSLAGDGPYSPLKSFYIAQPSQSTADIWSGVFGAFLVSGIFFGIFLFWKRKTSGVPKLFANVNPEYVSAATVYVADEWEVPRKNIELIRELGQGSFGMVYEGIARDIVAGQAEVRCAVKTVNEMATERDRMEFLNEASVMKAFNTHHVVQLLGVVSEGQPTLVVMELMVNGDLKTYLRSHRPEFCEDKKKQPPTLKRILGMAIEIADGMAYLAAKKFVHRDLAARNCMVAEDLTVKIGDFGMTRDIYETDYYKKGTKGLLPVRWMAPESLKDGVFTTHSDVWSYGVVLWEMVTLASQPYQGLSNDQVLRYVIEGGVMERPENCPDKLYDLMNLCWQYKPTARPHFMDFVSALLLDASPEFCKNSYYHSAEARELRAHIETADTELLLPTSETPLRLATDIEDFSVGGSEPELDEDEEEAELDVEPPFVSPQRTMLSSGSRPENGMKGQGKGAALASVSSSDSSRASKLSNGGANTPVNGAPRSPSYLIRMNQRGENITRANLSTGLSKFFNKLR